MYAIFEDGSHQFRVREGDRIVVDRREGEPGTELVFPKVLLVSGPDGATIGTPVVEGARRSPRSWTSFARRRSLSRSFADRKNYRRRKGHRQPHTMVQITSVGTPA